MRIDRILYLAGASLAMFSARPVAAQAKPGAPSKRDVVIHIHKSGDTTSIRNAAVTLDYGLADAKKTDAAGNVRFENLSDSTHVIEAIAADYAMLTEEFRTGPDVPNPIDFEMVLRAPPPKPAAPAKPR